MTETRIMIGTGIGGGRRTSTGTDPIADNLTNRPVTVIIPIVAGPAQTVIPVGVFLVSKDPSMDPADIID